jgi:putative ABC transport system permease protein
MVRAARRLLYALLPADIRDDVVAELDAEYARAIRPSRTSWRAAAWYWRQAVGSIGPALAMRRRRRHAHRGDPMHTIVTRWSLEAAQDLKFAMRLLARQKLFTAAVVATLALGIGATTAMFSLVDGVLIRPLPYREPDRLLRIWSANPRGIPRNQISPPDFFDWRDQVRGLSHLAGFEIFDVTLTTGGDPVRVPNASVTANLAETLGARPLAGRWFAEAETRGDGEPVVVVSERLWRERFGSDPTLIGRAIVVEGSPRTVIGVMPRSFEMPSGAIRIWLPLPDALRTTFRSARRLGAVARLAPGTSVEAARDSLLGVARHLAATYPQADRGWSVTVVPLTEAIVGDVRTALLVLLAAIGAVLLIACANVAGLLLARAVARSRELAVRTAVGATAGRLLRMQLVEAAALAAFGGVAGLALAAWCLQSIQFVRGLGLPLLDRVALDARGVAVAAALSFVCALAAGLWPSWKASRQSGPDAMGSGTRTTGGQVRARQAIVFAQIAIATALVAAGALLTSSFHRLTSVPTGFSADRTLLADVSLPGIRYARATRAPFFTSLLERIRALPGVQAAGAGGPLPLSGLDGLLRFALTLEGREPHPDGRQRAYLRWATADYFKAMGIEVRAGRTFTESDTATSAPVAVIDTELARRYFPGENAIGRKVRTPMDQNRFREIIGVVAAVRQSALDRDEEPHVYVPQAQLPSTDLTLVIRANGDAIALAPEVRRILSGFDAELPLANVRPLAELVAGSAAPRRISAVLLSAFAAFALLLTLVGVYGVVSQVVVQSTREIGVRVALGATTRDVLSLVVSRAVKLAIGGVVAGSILAYFATPALRAMLYGIGPRDPLTLLGSGLLLVAAAALAAYLPARRILRVDVVNALRVDG